MQDIIKNFLHMVIDHFPIHDPIYEIGSFQVLGQEGYADLRPYFPEKTYIGCDIRPGLGVDQIEDVHQLSMKENSVETVVILDTLEHVANPFQALAEIYRVLKDRGLLILSVPFNLQIHNFPVDYWRFTPSCIEMLLRKFAFSIIIWERYPDRMNPSAVYAVAIKENRPSSDVLRGFVEAAKSQYEIKIH